MSSFGPDIDVEDPAIPQERATSRAQNVRDFTRPPQFTEGLALTCIAMRRTHSFWNDEMVSHNVRKTTHRPCILKRYPYAYQCFVTGK